MSLLYKSLFFATLGNLLEAGFQPVRALKGNMPLPYQKTARKMAEDIENGCTLWQAMERRGFSKLDVALTRAGETAGTLPVTCALIREYYSEKRVLRQKYIASMVYPFFLYSFAVCVPLLVKYIIASLNNEKINTTALLLTGLFQLAIPWLLILAWKILSPLTRSIPVAFFIENIPFLKGLQNQRECSLFLTCFGHALNAGVGMEEAIRISGDVCVTALYRHRFRAIADKQRDTHLPFTTLASNTIPWTEDILAALQVGEMTGQLPEKADTCAKILGDRAQKRLTILMKAVTFVILALAMLKIIATIFSMATGYVNTLESF